MNLLFLSFFHLSLGSLNDKGGSEGRECLSAPQSTNTAREEEGGEGGRGPLKNMGKATRDVTLALPLLPWGQ